MKKNWQNDQSELQTSIRKNTHKAARDNLLGLQVSVHYSTEVLVLYKQNSRYIYPSTESKTPSLKEIVLHGSTTH